MKAKIERAIPCPRCAPIFERGGLRREVVQPLPPGAMAPLAQDGSGKCCYDCASADTLVRLRLGANFEMARIAVGNDRQDQYRLPGAPLGLVALGLVRPSAQGDFEMHLRWLDRALPEDGGR